MKKYIDKKRIIFSLIVLISLLLLVILNYRAYIVENKFNYVIFVLSIFLCIIPCIILAVKVDFDKKSNIFYAFFSIILSVLFSYMIIELLNENKLFCIYPKRLVFNFIIIILLHLFIYAISNRINLTILLSNSIIFILGFVNYTVTCFRGTPLVPWDILSLKTAAYVASSYTFKFSFCSLLAIIFFVFILSIGSKAKYIFKKRWFNVTFRIVTILIIVTLILVFYKTDVINYFDFENNLWKPRDEYLNNGFLASFLKQSKNLFNTEPENYLPSNINGILSKLETIPTFNYESLDEKPNIIVIMNESYSDLSVNRKL